MISLFQRAEIRRLFYAEHWPIGTIADAVGVHHETVRRALNRDRGIHPGPQIRPSALDPYKGFITATLEQYPRLRATRLWAMLRDRGYPGSAVQVRRYVRIVRPAARSEAYFRLDPLVGEQGQVDWGNFGAIQIGQARRVLSCFVLVLSWSRAVYARFALDQTLESFLRGHVEAFAALGGSPRALLYDNLKSVVLERSGEHIRFHPRLLELAGHYHFAPQPCAVARGNEKGRVERMIRSRISTRNSRSGSPTRPISGRCPAIPPAGASWMPWTKNAPTCCRSRITPSRASSCARESRGRRRTSVSTATTTRSPTR
jgi:transposase